MNPGLRKKLLWLHTWTGLTLGLVIVLLAVTGGGMVLRPVLDEIVNRDLLVVPYCTAPLPLDDLARRAMAVHPSGRLHSIDITADPNASVLVRFANKDQVFLNPCDGRVLGQQNEYGGYFGVVDWLHRFRFMDEGRLVAGWVSLAFFVVLIVGGVALWWPRKGVPLGHGLKFDPRLPGSARTLNLHRVVGIYSALLLLLITLTAIPISFVPVKQWIYRLAHDVESAKPKSLPAASGQPRLPMQTLYERARQAMPEQEWMMLRYPVKPGDSVEAEIREHGVPHADSKSYVFLDAHTGAVLRASHYAGDIGLGRKIYLYCIALHSGLVGGLPFQLLLLGAAFSIPVQAYSGLSPYLRRKLRKPVRTHLTLRLAKKTVLTPDISAFEFVDPQGRDLPPFTAGAHIDITVGEGLVRQYSLTGPAADRKRYVIAVLRHADSRGGSIAMHARLAVGESVRVGMPKNYFGLDATAPHSVLVAGGIGVTPILAMARQLAAAGRSFELHYCARSRGRAAFVDEIEASDFGGRTRLHFSDQLAGTAVDFHALLAKAPPASHLYVCGPSGFMDKVSGAAIELGWSDGQLHREHFAAEVRHLEGDCEFDVKLARSGKVVRIAKHRTVASVLVEAGIPIPLQCEQGVCGTCLTRVVAGEPDHRDAFLTAADHARKDVFTPCCSRARSPVLVLDL
ncbi:MAG: PepSY domain-containing protein [Burkholderiales bacterium]|nr:PepSY domain-containing protein [Burkholderiales bacterium]